MLINLTYVIKVALFTNCRSFKCLSHYNRSTMRNSILAKSHQNSLIDQRCRLSIKCKMCLFIPCCLWMLIDATISFDQHSHTQSLSLSLSLSLHYLAFFPHRFLPFINSLCSCVCINWNIDFTAFGCSHFKGNTNTKHIIKKGCYKYLKLNQWPMF